MGEKKSRKTIYAMTLIICLGLLGHINVFFTNAAVKNVNIESISSTGTISKGEIISLSIVIYNSNTPNYADLVLKLPNIYDDDLVFDVSNITFSINGDNFIELNTDLYINVTEGDYELLFIIEDNVGNVVSYRLYHLIIDTLGDYGAGLYNITMYNEINVNISIQNFVENIINNNITLYTDLFNEIFNYFNTTIYNDINTTVYNNLYNDIFNQINNTFVAEVFNAINNNITNLNDINNTILAELYNFIYSNVDITLKNEYEILLETNSLTIQEIIILVLAALCVAIGAVGILIGSPIILEGDKELDKLRNHTNIILKDKNINYKFKVGLAFLSVPFVQYLFRKILFKYINPTNYLNLPFYETWYSVFWVFCIFTMIIGIDNLFFRIISWISLTLIIMLNSFVIGISLLGVSVLLMVVFLLHNFGYIKNPKKKTKSETYYKI